MAPITLPLVAAALTEITVDTVRHAALGVEARLAAEFCGQLAQAREERTFRFDNLCREFEVLELILHELHQTGRIELPVLHTLQGHVQVQVAQLCATQYQNFQEYRAILGVKQHFSLSGLNLHVFLFVVSSLRRVLCVLVLCLRLSLR